MHKKEINNCIKQIEEKISKEEAKILLDIGTDLSELIDPQMGLFVGICKGIAIKSDAVRLNYMLKGLANENNVEMRLNQLYNFIKKPERAFVVSDLFRRTLLNKSPIVCCIYGIVLGKQVDGDSDLGYEDMIVLNALENATDYEINLFMEIVEKFIDDGFVDVKKINDEVRSIEYMLTLEWCKNYRVFGKVSRREVDGGFIFSEFMIVNSCTEKLYSLICEAKQLIRYEW